MDLSSPRIRSLLRQAEHVASVGKRAAAEKLYRQLVEEAPELPEAWTGLAEVVREPARQERYYQRALDLDPENEVALEGMSRLREPTAENRQPSSTISHPPEPTPVPSHESRIADEATSPHLHTPTTTQDEVVCYRHPNRQTYLRCISCGRPICSRCARRTPVGYRCPDCIREAEEVFFTATVLDHILALMVALPLSLIAGALVFVLGGSFGFFLLFIMVFVGGAIGGLIGRLAHRAAGRRRGRYLPYLVSGTVALGVLLPAIVLILPFLLGGGIPSLFSLLGPAIYLFVATSAAFYAMR